MRQVVKTIVEESGSFIRHWRYYDDGASAFWLKSGPRRIDKTVITIFNDGNGHRFVKNLIMGLDKYCNDNAGTERRRDMRTGEVRWFGPGGLTAAVLRSGDATLDAAN